MPITELERFGNQIREQGESQGRTMMDLVFDPLTGDFKQVPKGTHHVGDVVTDMAEKGFA